MNMTSTNKCNAENKMLPLHHVQQELCTTRPIYRQGKKLTAIKVYTVNNESQHLIIYRVPKINLCTELKTQCTKFGELKLFEVITKYKTDLFTECYHVQFERIQSARIAKRFLDNKSFYGELLHVCYAPEFETLPETKQKLLQRQKDVLSRLNPGPTISEYANVQAHDISQQNRKRKHPAVPITEKRLRKEGSEHIWNEIPIELDPRIKNTDISNIGFKKHFQIIQNRNKGVEYGPQLPNELNSVVEDVLQPTVIKTTLLPTNVIKKYEHNYDKKVVFRKKN